MDDEFDLDGSAKNTDVVRAVFFGLGADGTVGANKNSIKIIGEDTENFAQGYFVYDSKKSGAMTISHLRFGPRPIRAPYLIRRASFVACHQYDFLDRYDVLELRGARRGLPAQRAVRPGRDLGRAVGRGPGRRSSSKRLRFYVIDAYTVAREAGMGTRINTIMQTCFFAISGVLPRDEAIAQIKDAIRKTYSKRGDAGRPGAISPRSIARSRNLHRGDRCRRRPTARRRKPPVVSAAAPDFVQRVTAVMLANHGDRLPVSAFPRRRHLADGHGQVGEAQHRRRDSRCGTRRCASSATSARWCARTRQFARRSIRRISSTARPAPSKSVDFKAPAGDEFRGLQYTIQVAPEDCTGCTLCVGRLSREGQGQPEAQGARHARRSAAA